MEQSTYKLGDQAPSGYLAWHEWAEVQHKAGLRQKQCGKCALWHYPQELSTERIKWEGTTSRGRKVKQMVPVCLKCLTPSDEWKAVYAPGTPASLCGGVMNEIAQVCSVCAGSFLSGDEIRGESKGGGPWTWRHAACEPPNVGIERTRRGPLE